LEKINDYLALVGGLLVFVMSVLTSADIVGRQVLGKAIPGTYEIVQYLMVYVIFFAIADLESKNGNVRVELLATHLSKRGKALLSIAGAACGLFIFVLMLYANGIYTWESWVGRETMYGIQGAPLYIWKFGVPLGCFFMRIQLTITITKATRRMIAGER